MASSKQSTTPATPSATTSPEPRETSTSSPTTSTSSTNTVVVALGSNLGDRGWNLRRALHALRTAINIVRVSAIHESAAVDAPEGSPPFLNLVLIGTTALTPTALLDEMLAIEKRLGRVRRGVRNEPRIIDIDLILHGATRMRTRSLTLPHPRASEREFVMGPLREFGARGTMLVRQIARYAQDVSVLAA